MTTINAGRPLIDLVQLCYAANRPLLLIGRHGVGKSVLLEQAARSIGIGYICRDLSLMEPPDLIGLPKVNGKSTRYYPPSFLPTDGKGLIVFEELNRCPSYMRAPTLQLLTARSLNDYRLPSGWLPVAAINPADAGYEADELDPALMSRFVRVAVEPNREEWLAWARAEGLHAGVLAYAQSEPTIFDDDASNPRAWSDVSAILFAAAQSGASRESIRAAVVGLVGDERGAAFLTTLSRPVRPLTADEILHYPDHAKPLNEWINTGDLDLVKSSLLALKKHLQVKRNYDAAKGDRTLWRNLGAFLADLPGDLREEAETFFHERHYDHPGRVKRRRA